MSLNGNCYECTLCASQGKKSLVRPLQISINDALIGCEDPECWYPFGIDSKTLLVRSSYKSLESNEANQVIQPTPHFPDNNDHRVPADICNDLIFDDFQLDALLQDCSVQIDDDFCQDLNSFLNGENQESDQPAESRLQEKDITGDHTVVPDIATCVPEDFKLDKGNFNTIAKVEMPSLISSVCEQKNVNFNQKYTETIGNQSIQISPPSTKETVDYDDTIRSRDISERCAGSVVKGRQLGNSGVGTSKPSRSLVGKKPLSPPVKKSLVDAMKYADSDDCDIALKTAKSKSKSNAAQANRNKKPASGKPNLNFFLW